MSTRQFEKERTEGFPAPAYLIQSKEEFLLFDAFATIRETFSFLDAFNFDVYDAGGMEPVFSMDEVISRLNTFPFMGGRRISVVRNAQKIPKKDQKKLVGYLADPCPSSLLVLIMFSDKSPKLFEGDSAPKNIRIISLSVYGNELASWIRKRASSKGLTLGEDIAEYLISVVGTDLGLLASEIGKIAVFMAGRDGPCRLDEIKNTVYQGAEYTSFQLADAIIRRDAKASFKMCETLLLTTEPIMILGGLNYRFWGRKNSTGGDRSFDFRTVFRHFHETDIALKRSHPCAIELLVANLLE